jgi:hypothetical protein
MKTLSGMLIIARFSAIHRELPRGGESSSRRQGSISYMHFRDGNIEGQQPILRPPMNRITFFCLLIVALTLPVFSQTTPAPAQPDANTKPAAKDDISGMYSFMKDGEFVQINQEEGGIITGFVSRFGDDETDKKTFLDQFFSKASLTGNTLTFATKVVHGTWFEFTGAVQQQPGKKSSDEGYRLIKGKLTRHKPDAKGNDSPESREIEMKSFPADMDED